MVNDSYVYVSGELIDLLFSISFYASITSSSTIADVWGKANPYLLTSHVSLKYLCQEKNLECFLGRS